MANPVVIAEKLCNKGRLHGSLSNGGAIIDLGNGKGIKFIAVNAEFVTLQVLEYGMGKEVKTQSWVKTKKVVVKEEKNTIKPKASPKVTLKTSDDIQEDDLW
jgi:hypothetical protein|tara:strand:- start:31026 stop:31331 length:306 start_codon:yes stop_codon:yes gene_type:complete